MDLAGVERFLETQKLCAVGRHATHDAEDPAQHGDAGAAEAWNTVTAMAPTNSEAVCAVNSYQLH